MLGAKRWLIVVLLAGMAVLQAGLLGVWRFGSPALAHDVGLFGALCLLAVSLSLWPFLNYVKRRLNLTLDEQIRRRLRLAEARAAEARHWLLMAEEVANVGHWRIGFPDHQLFCGEGRPGVVRRQGCRPEPRCLPPNRRKRSGGPLITLQVAQYPAAREGGRGYGRSLLRAGQGAWAAA